jgi:hypothetical protein
MPLTPTAALKPLEKFAKQIGASFYWHQRRDRKALLDLIAADGSRIVVCAKLALPLAPLDEERAWMVVAELTRGATHSAALLSTRATWDAFQGWLLQSPELRAEYEEIIRKMRPRRISTAEVLP